eukprot:405761-Prorocentrum_minimum.AAC.1
MSIEGLGGSGPPIPDPKWELLGRMYPHRAIRGKPKGPGNKKSPLNLFKRGVEPSSVGHGLCTRSTTRELWAAAEEAGSTPPKWASGGPMACCWSFSNSSVTPSHPAEAEYG